MSKVAKKCHWVPQSYLRHFACDERREKIFRFSKSYNGCDLEAKPIRKVAVRHYLYVPIIDGYRDASVEDKLSEIDRIFTRDMWDLLSDIKVNIASPSIKNALCLITSIMLARTPDKLDEFISLRGNLAAFLSRIPGEISGSIGTTLYGSFSSLNFEEFLSLSDEEMKRIWSKLVIQGGGFLPIIRKMRISGVVSREGLFITSDRPVTVIHPSLENKGIEDPDSFLVFAISPHLLIVFDHKTDTEDGLYYHADKRVCQYYNLMTWRNSIEFMFSPRHPDEVCTEFLTYSYE